MPALTVVCINPPAYSRPLSITIPGLGTIEALQDFVTSIPSPDDIVAKFMNMVNLALAPLRKYLRVVQAIIAIKDCIEAIPKAIITLSPQPLFDCFKSLIRAIAHLIQDIPPIPYIQTIVDVCRVSVELVDAVAATLTRLDNKLTALLDLRNYAAALGDVELVSFSNCGMKDITLGMLNLLDMLKILVPINNLLLSVILRMIPTPEAQRAANDMAAAAVAFDDASTQLQTINIEDTGLPSLSDMMAAMNVMRPALVTIHNTLAVIIGEAADLQHRELPTYVNF